MQHLITYLLIVYNTTLQLTAWWIMCNTLY